MHVFYFPLQAVPGTTPVSLEGIGLVFTGLVLVWFIKTMMSVRDMVRDHRVTLHGEHGQGGVVKEVFRLRSRTHRLSDIALRHHGEIGELWSKEGLEPRAPMRRDDDDVLGESRHSDPE